MELLMLQGLPASGKSLYARTLDGYVRINKDDLREMLHDGKYSSGNEKQVIACRNLLIEDALKRGKNVVVDDTNFNLVHHRALQELAEKYGAEFVIKEFDVPVDECIKRDLERPRSVGERVIRQMWRQYVAPKQERVENTELPKAIIFDIDGTLAIKGDRGYYDWSKVGLDTLNKEVADILLMTKITGFRTLIFSGRDESCREITTNWLTANLIPFNELHMRTEEDNRKDVIVKTEMYDACKDRYNIVYAVDDRLQVCRMWYEKGLCLLKVGDPDLEF